MSKYAQIVNGKVHGIFEYNKLPAFAPNIVMINIDNANPQPKIGWEFDGTNFSEPSGPSLNELKIEKLDDLKAYIDERYQSYITKYPEVEVQSFKDKAQEAALIEKDANTPLEDTPYLPALASNDIDARNALADAISAKVNEVAQLEALGSNLRDRINSATTVDELEAITWQ